VGSAGYAHLPKQKDKEQLQTVQGYVHLCETGRGAGALRGCFYQVPEAAPSSWACGAWIYTRCILHLETSGV